MTENGVRPEEKSLQPLTLIYSVRDFSNPKTTPRKDRPDYETSLSDFVLGVSKIFDSYRLLP